MLFIWIAKNQRSKNLDSTKSVKKVIQAQIGMR